MEKSICEMRKNVLRMMIDMEILEKKYNREDEEEKRKKYFKDIVILSRKISEERIKIARMKSEAN